MRSQRFSVQNVAADKLRGLLGLAKVNYVQRTGSLSQAARAMGMSYRRAWLLMQSLNDSLRSPASIAVRGGRRGGGATVTPTGRALIQAYRRTEARVGRNVSARFAKFARPAATSSKPPDRVRTPTRKG